MAGENTSIQPSKKITFSTMSKFLRKYSVVVAYYLNNMGVHPNRVVLFRVFFFGGLSMYLFFSELYRYNVLGLFTIFLCYFFDLVDGDLARNYNMKTAYGKFLDEELDSVVVTSLVLTFACKFYLLGYPSYQVLGGIFALFGIIGSSKMTNMFQNTFDINCVSGNALVEKKITDNQRDQWSEFFYQLVTPKNIILSFFSNFRYYLLGGILFQQMQWTILLFAIAINLRWILLFICVSLYYKSFEFKKKYIHLFGAMRSLEKIN